MSIRLFCAHTEQIAKNERQKEYKEGKNTAHLRQGCDGRSEGEGYSKPNSLGSLPLAFLSFASSAALRLCVKQSPPTQGFGGRSEKQSPPTPRLRRTERETERERGSEISLVFYAGRAGMSFDIPLWLVSAQTAHKMHDRKT